MHSCRGRTARRSSGPARAHEALNSIDALRSKLLERETAVLGPGAFAEPGAQDRVLCHALQACATCGASVKSRPVLRCGCSPISTAQSSWPRKVLTSSLSISRRRQNRADCGRRQGIPAQAPIRLTGREQRAVGESLRQHSAADTVSVLTEATTPVPTIASPCALTIVQIFNRYLVMEWRRGNGARRACSRRLPSSDARRRSDAGDRAPVGKPRAEGPAGEVRRPGARSRIAQ